MPETDIIKVQEVNLVPQVVKDYFCKNATPQEIGLFIEVCKNTQLNPFKREIYLVKYGDNPASILTGYETYLKRAEASGKWDGYKVWIEGEGITLKAKIHVYRKDWSRPFEWEVSYKEAVQMKKDGTPNTFWKNKPETMLKKVAISQGIRLAFPDEVGGLPYTTDEITSDVQPEKIAEDIVKDKAKQAGYKVETKLTPENEPLNQPDTNAEQPPIDIHTELVGGTKPFKDKTWVEAPLPYLESLLNPKYSENISPRKLDAIKRAIAYKKEHAGKSKDEVKQTEPLTTSKMFDEKGELTPLTKEHIANAEQATKSAEDEKETEQALRDTLDGQNEWVIDVKKEDAPPPKDLIEFFTWFLSNTKLFTKAEAERLINGMPKLPYNLAIAQFNRLKAVYTERFGEKYGKKGV